MAPAFAALAAGGLRPLLSRILWSGGDFRSDGDHPGTARRHCQRSAGEEIEKLARQTGMVTLFEHGCMAVEQGHTTLGELVQMLGESDGG